MKEIITKNIALPGKAVLNVATLIMLLFFTTAVSFGQSTCVKADFDFTVDHSNKSVKFEAKASSNAIAYLWDFGTGSTTSGATTAFAFKKAGEYKVCLTVYGYNSSTMQKCSLTICKKVVIRDCDLQADFAFKTDGAGFYAEAKSNSKTAVYGWDFGDGNDARGRETKHQYSKAGNYTVCLVVKDTATDCVTRVCKKVEVKGDCNLEADFAFKIDGSGFYAEAKSNSKTAVYGWDFGDGNDARGRETKHQYSKPGNYTVCVVVKDTANDCVTRVCKNITVKGDCDLEADFAITQDGNAFKFQAKASNANALLLWDFGDGNDGKGSEIKHEYGKPGVYAVCVTAILKTASGTQLCSTRVCKKVEVKDRCELKADFEFGQDGNAFKFRAKANDAHANFIWDFGDGNESKGDATGHKYEKPGVYRVCVTAFVATSTSRCTTTVCKKVEVKGKDNPCKDTCNLRVDFKLEVNDNKVTVKAHANQDGTLFSWSWGDGNQSVGTLARYKFKKYGVQQICLVAFNPKTKCKEVICKRILIEEPCDLKANFKYRLVKNQIVLKARSNSKTAVYGWSFGDGSDDRGRITKHTYAKAGVYVVTLIAYDKETGCKIEVKKKILIDLRTKFIPLEAPENGKAGDLAGEVQNKTEETLDQLWSVVASPVPSQNRITFETETKTIVHTTIYGMDGSKVLDSDVEESNRAEVDITTLPNGFYVAHVLATDGSIKIVRFLKN